MRVRSQAEVTAVAVEKRDVHQAKIAKVAHATNSRHLREKQGAKLVAEIEDEIEDEMAADAEYIRASTQNTHLIEEEDMYEHNEGEEEDEEVVSQLQDRSCAKETTTLKLEPTCAEGCD
jgi:hypothetical protein